MVIVCDQSSDSLSFPSSVVHLNPNNNLSKIRIELENLKLINDKLIFSQSFQNNRIEDEKNTLLKDILVKKDTGYELNLICSNT